MTELRARLAEAEETLRAIRAGEVDAMVGTGEQGERVYTLQSADLAYRTLVESMNEGAVTLLPDGVILYANQCFARMVARPLEQVIGSSFHHFLSETDQAVLAPSLQRVGHAGAKVELILQTGDGGGVPAGISICPLGPDHSNGSALCLVVTDMTEPRRNEKVLRDLTHRLIQTQEAERGRVANDLRVNITQLLYVILGRCQALADKLPPDNGSASGDTAKINEMLRKTAEEVAKILREDHIHLYGFIDAAEREIHRFDDTAADDPARARGCTRRVVSARRDGRILVFDPRLVPRDDNAAMGFDGFHAGRHSSDEGGWCRSENQWEVRRCFLCESNPD
jgi:PAS domain S-box-containing protein